MKTQSFGKSPQDSCNYAPFWLCPPLHFGVSALKNYRENRENGLETDNPKYSFPSAGFDTLEIKRSYWQVSDKWPDKQGRYWWKLTLTDGRVIEDFYWTKDEIRGWPDKNEKNRYWFIVHHEKVGRKIEGFSQEPDYNNGFPDQNEYYWCYIRYTECGAIARWMEEKDRNYLIRTIGDLLRILNKAPLFKRLPDELQIIIFEFVIGGKLSTEVWDNAKTYAKQGKIQLEIPLTTQPHHTQYGFKGGKALKGKAHREIPMTAEVDASYDEAECSSTCSP